jgi:hypothetical protein
MNNAALLAEAYRPLIGFADVVDERLGWTPTQLPGWTVRDLLFHLATDGQRALVAFATPSEQAADTDDITYWSHWQPNTDDAEAGLRGTRIMASAWSGVQGPARLFAQTARAVLRVARAADQDAIVQTQGHQLRVGALISTLTVEATVHHLDLFPALPTEPSPDALGEVRRVLDGLLGAPGPPNWRDAHYARVGTGRLALTDTERLELGERAKRFPLFG